MTRRWAGPLVFAGALALAPVFAAQSLQGTAVLAGRVLDQSGAPVPAAVVAVRRAGVQQPRGPEGAGERVLTDDQGRFVVSRLAAARFEIQATKPGWLDGAYGRTRPGGPAGVVDLADAERWSDIVVTLWRAAVIAGRVTDDTGDPLVNVEVRAARQVMLSGRRQSETPIRAKTDDRGQFRFAGLMPGDYLVAVLGSVLVEPPAFAGAMRGGGNTTRVFYETMTAVGTAPILFSRATGVTGSDRPLLAGLSPLPGMPGDEAWPIHPTTYHPSTRSARVAELLRVAAGETRTDADVRVTLTPSWQVSGTLRTGDGSPAWHAVHLVPVEDGERPLVDVATAVTDATGAFDFYGVPPGQYMARVVRTPPPAGNEWRMGIGGGTGAIPHIVTYGGSPTTGPPAASTEPLRYASATVTVADRHVRGVELRLQDGPRIRGRVRFDGAPPAPDALRQLRITTMPADGRIVEVFWPAAISADGQFMSPGLTPGRYHVIVSPPPGWTLKHAMREGRDVSELPLDLQADVDDVVVTLTDRPLSISGTVQVDAGQAADKATVLIFPVSAAEWVDYGRNSRRMSSAPVSTVGAFSLPLPPPGDYHLVAIPDEQADEWQNPEVLTRLAALAERVRVREDMPLTTPLTLRRLR